MKFLVLFAVSCFAVSANAQITCLNPGSVIIPPSPCCGQMQGQGSEVYYFLFEQRNHALFKGLAGALGAIFDLMDLECKVNIFFDAVITDPDVTAFFNYITGPEFREIALAVQELEEFEDFMWYLCEQLDLDAYLYLNTLGDILGIPRVPHPEGPDCHPEVPFPWISQKHELNVNPMSMKDAKPFNSGVRNLMDTLKAETDSDAIYDMWVYKVANDPYLCSGFLKLSSVEFKTIAKKVELHPEFIRFVMKLEEWGIEMKQFMDDLKWFLWDSDYCRS